MSELSTEAQAEDALISAVLSPVNNPDTDDLDALEARDVTSAPEAEVAREGAEEEAPEQEAQAAAEDDGEEYIEVPTEDGKEPLKISLKDAVEAVQARQAFEAEKSRIVEQVSNEARQHALQMVQQTRQGVQQVQHQLQAVLQLIAPPQPPPPELLNPNSPHYNPDNYHLQRANYEQSMMRYQQVQQNAQGLAQMAQAQQAWEEDQRLSAEEQRLRSAWPGFYEQSDAFVSEMTKHYGYSAEELDASLNDHRNALVARDALAYRKLMAKGPEIKKQVEAKAPKITRTKNEPKGTATQSRDPKGQFTNGALQTLRKTQSDDAAAAFFAGLSRAGRI